MAHAFLNFLALFGGHVSSIHAPWSYMSLIIPEQLRAHYTRVLYVY